jgi:Ricin-type beta-trefoil lectin domain-like
MTKLTYKYSLNKFSTLFACFILSLINISQLKAQANDQSLGNRCYVLNSGTLMLRSSHSGLYIDVAGASLEDLADIITWTKSGSKNQIYKVIQHESKWFALAAEHSNKVLSLKLLSESNKKIVQESYTGSANQLWAILRNSTGRIRLINKQSRDLLSITDESKELGSKLFTSTYLENNRSQIWHLRKSSPISVKRVRCPRFNTSSNNSPTPIPTTIVINTPIRTAIPTNTTIATGTTIPTIAPTSTFIPTPRTTNTPVPTIRPSSTSSPLPTNTITPTLPSPTNTPISISTGEQINGGGMLSDNKIQLPLEIIGSEGHTVSVNVTTLNGATAKYLWVQVNNLSYDNKGSFQINSGPWIDLKNSLIDRFDSAPEKAWGGIGGGYNTIRFRVPINGITNGSNTIKFRFNKSDGISAGYRILNFNLLDSAGNRLIAQNSFVYEDPSKWRAPRPNQIDIGKDLWFTAKLKRSPNSGEIKAQCSDCHALNGRDLKYFNYSNYSIIERSKYHGLSQEQGEQIASYIRTLNVPAPTNSRPWNPPYQPAPGLDSKPVENWAAGGGLEAVLDRDIDTFNDMFPGFNGGANISAISKKRIEMGGNIQVNLRESRMAVQFPDWKHWLPFIHPKDAYGDAYKPTQERINRIREFLNKYGKAYIVGSAGGRSFWNDIRDLSYSSLFSEGESTPTPFSTRENWSHEQQKTRYSIGLWLLVQIWDLMHTYNIEGHSQELYRNLGADRPDPRGWPQGNERFVFAVSPFLTPVCSNTQNLWLGRNLCQYYALAWYDMAVILNPGNRFHEVHNAIDWIYFYTRLYNGWRDAGHDLREPGRFAHLLVAALQEADSNIFGVKNMGRGFSWFAATPLLTLQQEDKYVFDANIPFEKNVLVAFINASMGAMLDKIEKYPTGDWERRSQEPRECWYLCEQWPADFDKATKRYSEIGVDPQIVQRTRALINRLYNR